MPKVKRPQIAGPSYDDDMDDAAPAQRRPSRRARDVPYSVAWFRDRIATYALGTIVCGSAMFLLAMWMGGSLGAFGDKMNRGFDVIAGWAGVSLKEVEVCGPKDEDSRKKDCPAIDGEVVKRVLAASEVQAGESLISADPYVIRDRVEKLDVGAVAVRRLWPDKVRIEIDQREAVALWQEHDKGGAWRVVDQSGRAFAEADLTKYHGLPHVVGKDAAGAAASLMAEIAKYPTLRDRMEVAYRVGGRRWDIKFSGRTDVIAFPTDEQLPRALEQINMLHATSSVLDAPAGRIDVRKDGTIAVQKLPAPSPIIVPGGA
jgi:cell division protein FtsQ